ncbi:MAG: DUF3368 domain-containing protein [Xenococcus sp. MO_188.B8]|nr:DUF3368 domain-containing protein [Xenococcus sp. MO_188.B8]
MPKQLIIVNTSPLLYLHQVGCLELLQKLYQNIYVPNAVQEELNVGKNQGIDIPKIDEIAWIKICSVSSVAVLPTVIDLGKGEAEVIALGIENNNSLLVIDDQLARRIADLYNLKYTGTLGVLIKAKQAGYLKSIATVIRELRNQGMWLTDQIVNKVIKLAGE